VGTEAIPGTLTAGGPAGERGTLRHSIPPLRDLPAGRLAARKQHLLTEITRSPNERRGFSLPSLIGPRRRVAALALAVGLVVIGTAVAATTDWLTGSPAPKSVVSDFGTYAPQLGFNPEPGRAVQVAADGDTILYATMNKQGSYCLIASASWKRPSTLPDGGTCIAPAQASAPLIAGLVGAKGSPDGQETYVIAGRTTEPDARTIRFSDPTGAALTRPVGSSGFFIATIHTDLPACASGDWKPTFSVVGADGLQRSSDTITLGSARAAAPGVCVFAAPHA
jgi:hypothetical protein